MFRSIAKMLRTKRRRTGCLVLAAMMIMFTPAKADYMQISPDLTIHWKQAGTGDITIIFIPGWLMSSDVFTHQLDHFATSTKFRAISYDPRGQGRSSKTAEGHSYQQHGRDLAAFIKQLDSEKIILAAWSYGVLEGLAYVNQFGADRLAGLIVIDGTPVTAGASYDDWVWYLRDDSGEYSRYFT